MAFKKKKQKRVIKQANGWKNQAMSGLWMKPRKVSKIRGIIKIV